MPETISSDYLSKQKELHKNPNYGCASASFAPLIAGIISNFSIKSVSDYGAGKKKLHDCLVDAGSAIEEYFAYYPAFPEYGAPEKADLVCCIDVLEHIEIEYIDKVLKDIASIVRKYAFFSIHTGPAIKALSDGRNAHIIQAPTSWWMPKLSGYFEILELRQIPSGFWVFLAPKINKIAINSLHQPR